MQEIQVCKYKEPAEIRFLIDKNIQDPFYSTKILILSKVCPKKSGPFHWLGVDLNLFKAYLGPHGVTPRAIDQFLEPGKKRVFSKFGLHPLVHIEYPRAESGFCIRSTFPIIYILLLLCLFVRTLLVCFLFAYRNRVCKNGAI